ncbi:unnamed protein product [Phytomonas sp. EM1]|nr:unnamed protein product [Phytomonas sp. EM1]|eukprot:CCW60768.1 unnamed protein product [Phytomonas sp. isolate EM1]
MDRTSIYGPMAPKVIPGVNSSVGSPESESFSVVHNTACFPHQSAHYGVEDLLACGLGGSQGGATIRIFDMNSVQLVQTLHGHRGSITALLWKPPSESCQQHQLLLFSGDSEGMLHLWDVVEGLLLSSIQVSCRRSIRVLSLFSPQHLLVLTEDSTSYVFDAQLAHPIACSSASALFSLKDDNRTLSHFRRSKLSAERKFLLIFGGRLRVVSDLNLLRQETVEVRDLVYKDSDVEGPIVDAFFSEAVGELIYFATPNSIGLYDWPFNTILEEHIFELSDGVRFLRIFPSSPGLTAGSVSPSVPVLYSFGSDQRLVAWYLAGGGFTTVSEDIRSTRALSRAVVNVIQSEGSTTLFVVLFEDGSLSKWGYEIQTRRWRLTNFYTNPLYRAVCACGVGASRLLCVGLEGGHLAVMDAAHNLPLRRFHLASFGNTKIHLLFGRGREEAVWVVSSRAVEGRYRIQVSLLDTRSGEVVFTLRAPSATAELTQVKHVSMDPSFRYLLLVFWNGTFEVWNTEERRLIRSYAELGVGNISWAPTCMRSCLRDFQGTPQLLLVTFTEGVSSLWMVYPDRVVSNPEVAFHLPQGGINNTVQSVAVGSRIVLFDAMGSGVVLYTRGREFLKLTLKDVPLSSCPVRGLASLASDDEAIASGDPSSTRASPNNAEAEKAPHHLVAVVLDDHSFGVWDTETGDRVGYSARMESGALITASSIFWVGRENVAVLGLDGAIYLMHYTIRTVNSKMGSRPLRRPLENMAFLPPSYRIYLQSSIELVGVVDPLDVVSPSALSATQWQRFCAAIPSPSSKGDPAGARRSSASWMISHIATDSRPCRGPFGQLLAPTLSSLEEELQLYRQTMIPSDIQTNLMRAHARGRWWDLLYWSARLFGQVEKQRFWAQARLFAATPNGNTGFNSPVERDATTTRIVDRDSTPSNLGRLFYFPYPLADAFTPYLDDPTRLLHNRLALVEARGRVLGKDPATRLSLARELLKLRHPTRAVDLLLDGHHEGVAFNELSTLAVAIAAVRPLRRKGGGGGGGGGASTRGSFFHVAAKRAAAVHLSRGEVEAAVEKYLLANDPREAAHVLQFQGRWQEAAAVIQHASFPSEEEHPGEGNMEGEVEEEEEARREVFRRWGVQCGKVGQCLEAARVFLHIRDPTRALRVLSESANFVDISGMLAMGLGMERPSSAGSPPPHVEAGGGLDSSVGEAALGEAMIAALTDYSSVLSSVGYFAGEALVLERLALLKMSLRGPPKAAP